jgi:WD40 repeat protein
VSLRLADWLREERDFLVCKGDTERAQRRWLAMGQVERALLTGFDLARAEESLTTRSEDLSPEVTAFVQSSAAADRAAKERQLRFQRRVSIGGVAAALLMTVVSGFAWFQWGRADRELVKAQTTQSLFLADLARQRRTAGDAGTAALLALEALPDDTAEIARPYLPEAELQLDGGWRDLRERLVLTGHAGAVYSVAFSPDGKRIVTASRDSRDKTARLWDAETGKPIIELIGHASGVWSAMFSPDGKRIVTASADRTARLWDAETGKPIGEPLTGHADGVLSAAFSPDGKRIVTASADTTARLWDAETGKPIGEPLTGHAHSVSSVAFSSDGKRIVTASWDKTARLWDAGTGQQIGEPLAGHASFVLSAAFSPDGKRIVTASGDRTAIWLTIRVSIITEFSMTIMAGATILRSS